MAEEQHLIPRISVVVPVKNEAKRLRACLEGIVDQTIPVEEIIVIDSGSTDGTQGIATGYPKVKLVEIDPGEFNHGGTRNLGASLANGEYVLFTVGDARPVSDDWIEGLLDGFVSDAVAGVCGLQVVAHDKDTNPVEWFRPQSQPEISTYQYHDANAFEKTSPEEKRVACGWDDVSAMYRKDVLKKIPFRETVYGEDVFWAIDALKNGYALSYNPGARVYHFHLNSYETMLKRTIAVSYLRYKALAIKPPKLDFTYSLVKSFYTLIKEPSLSLSERAYWIRYNFKNHLAITTGISMFLKADREGKSELDLLYKKYCGAPPIPLKHM